MKKFETLFLHVGLEKTGTTSIQRALHSHREKLEEFGYYYPKCFAVGRNTLLAAMVHPSVMDRPNFRMVINNHGGTQENHIEEMLRLFEAEIDTTEAQQLILSSEFLAAHTDIGALKSIFSKYAKKIKVVLYLREQSSLLLSLHSTRLKAGGLDFGAIEHVRNGRLPAFLNFRSIVTGLEAHFDRNDIILRLFEKSQMRNGNAIDDFLTTIGLAEHAAEFAVERANESLSHKGMDLLQHVNPYMPNIINGQKNKARGYLLNDVSQLDGRTDFGRPTLTQEDADSIKKLTADSNEWVRRRYFPKQQQLFMTSAREGRQKNTPRKTLDYSAQLIADAYNRIAELEDENRELKADKKKDLKTEDDFRQETNTQEKTETESATNADVKTLQPKAIITPGSTNVAEGSYPNAAQSGLKRIILHIGRHKSGTSALQHFFHSKRQELDSFGVLYPISGTSEGQVAHHAIANACNQNSPDVAALGKIVKGIKAELNSHHHTLLISSEAFQNITQDKWIVGFLSSFPGVEIEIICYVREFADYMVSAFRQAVQNQIRFQTFPKFCEHRYNIKGFLALWETIGNLRLKWFHPDLLMGQDIIEDFFQDVAIPKPDGDVDKLRNPSIGGNLLWLKMAANKACLPFIGYAQMAALAQQYPRFREHFYVPQYRLDKLRKTSKYNSYFEKRIGPVPYKSWEHCRLLPDDVRLDRDIEIFNQAHPKFNLAPFLALKKESLGWFWTQT